MPTTNVGQTLESSLVIIHFCNHPWKVRATSQVFPREPSLSLNPDLSFVMILVAITEATMEVLPDYELLEVVTEEEPCTFRARQVSSGRTVLLHRLSGGGPYPDQIGLIRTVVQYLRKASSSNRRLVLDMAEHEGAVYLITEALPGFRTFSQWLASELKGQEEAPTGSLEVTAWTSAPPPEEGGGKGPTQRSDTKSSSSNQEPGEFTRMFQGPAVASPLPDQADVANPGSEKVASLPELEKSTEMFKPSGSDKSQPLATEVPRETSEKLAAPPEGGEFTRIFERPTVDRFSGVHVEVPEASSDRAPASAEPGEFTRLFQASAADKAAPRPAQIPDSISGTAAGEFTAIFKLPTGADRPGAPDIQLSAPKEVSEFTRLFGSPARAEASFERPPTSGPGEPPASAPLSHNESASGLHASPGAKPQGPAAQPGPAIPPISDPKVAEKSPLAGPKAPSISPLTVPAKPSLPARLAEPPIPHAPPVNARPMPKVPQPVPPKLPRELPRSDKRPSYLPWVLLLGGLVLLGALLIVYVFVRS
jgi:hypothetical protein